MRLSPKLMELEEALRQDIWEEERADAFETDQEYFEALRADGITTGIETKTSPHEVRVIQYYDSNRLVDLLERGGDEDTGLEDTEREEDFLLGTRTLLDHVTAFAEMLGADTVEQDTQFCARAIANSLANHYYGGRYAYKVVHDYYPAAQEEATV